MSPAPTSLSSTSEPPSRPPRSEAIIEITPTGDAADDLEISEAPPSQSRWEALSPHDSEGRKRIIGIVIAVVAIAALFTDPQAIQAVILGAGSGALIAALA